MHSNVSIETNTNVNVKAHHNADEIIKTPVTPRIPQLMENFPRKDRCNLDTRIFNSQLFGAKIHVSTICKTMILFCISIWIHSEFKANP